MNNEVEAYYSHGKFLITAEYLVLSGAEALVLPINKGQRLSLHKDENYNLSWLSFYGSELWFDAEFNPETYAVVKSSDDKRANYISQLLKYAAELSRKRKSLEFHSIETELEFNPDWGMGSSSTLLVNVSNLFDVNAFELHQKMSNGSGFDVAAALSGFPFRYKIRKNKREIIPVRLPKIFYEHTFFVYLGKKTSSHLAVDDFMQQEKKDMKMPVKYINEITAQFTELEDVKELSSITAEHEEFMESILGQPSPVHRFTDYPYGMKSLGAWGGDFIMAVHPKGKAEVKKYFEHKGLPVVFSAGELRISN